MLSHEQIEDIKAQAYLCLPSNLSDVCKVYPVKLKSVIEMGYLEYSRRLNTLLLTEIDIQNIIKEKINEEVSLEEIHPLKYLLDCADQNDIFSLELQLMFITFLQEDVLLLPDQSSILVGNIKEKRLITEENFKDFQDILRIQNRKEIKEGPPKNETYGERKMRLLREKVAAAKRKQAEKEGNSSELSLADELEIASVYNIDIENCSLYAFYGLLRRHQARDKYLQDIQMLCAGADTKEIKIKYWGDNLDKD